MGVPYSNNDPSEWKSRIAVVNGQDVTVYEPITAEAVVSVPALSIGGIGLTNSTTKLEVIGDISGSGNITSSGSISAGKTKFETFNSILALFGNSEGLNIENYAVGQFPTDTATYDKATRLNCAPNGVIQFFQGGSLAVGSELARFKSTGEFGIGTTNPTEKLQVSGNIKATGTITGKKQFYQTVNSYNNQVNNLPVSLTSNLTSKLNNNGLASLASNWTRFPSWKQNLSNDTINTDLNNGNDLLGVFQDVLGGYGVKVKAAGYYKATCQMHFYSTTANTSVAIRFAKNALVDDVQDQDTENPGPCQMSNVSANTASSACLSHVMLCAVDDVISVYTSKAGADGQVVTSPASCTLLIEFFGLDV